MCTCCQGHDSIKSSRTGHVYIVGSDAINFMTEMKAYPHMIKAITACTLVLTWATPHPLSATETITLQAGDTVIGQFVSCAGTGGGSSGTFLAQWA